AAGIPTWSPTVVLICRSTAYVWQSGRDAQFSADCGRTCLESKFYNTSSFVLEMWIGDQCSCSRVTPRDCFGEAYLAADRAVF
ncbi:hypothetical protein KCU64_g16191, partial [Aureobasidium melanogenum]